MQEKLPRGAAYVAAFYKTRPVFCPSGQPKSWLFNFAPGKISLGTLLGCCKRAKEYNHGARGARTAVPKKITTVNDKHKNQKVPWVKSKNYNRLTSC